MSIRRRRALPTFTLLTALLVTPTLAQARPSRPDHQGRPAATASAGFLGNLWHLLTSLWGAAGGSIDPRGGQGVPHSGNPGATGDSGGSIDPNG